MPPIIQALLWLILVVAAAGILLYALRGAPIDPRFRWIIDVLIAIAAVVVLFTYVAPLIGAGWGSGGPHRLRC